MKLQFQAAGRRCSSNLCPILHSSDALISASDVASSIPRLWLLTSSQDSPQLQVHSRKYVCSTCVDAHNRLCTNSACGQRSHMCPGPRPDRFLFNMFNDGPAAAVRSSPAVFPAPFTMQGTIDGCFVTPCMYVARARFAWSPFFFGAASVALQRGAGPRFPRSFSPCKLDDEADRC